MCPSENKTVSLQDLVAPRRSGGAIREAAEIARNIARPIGVVIATEDGVLLVWRPVHARIVVVIVVDNRCVAGIVIELGDRATSGHVRFREERNELGHRGVDSAGRNLIVWQGKTGCRVIDRRILNAYPRTGRLAEVANPFVV